MDKKITIAVCTHKEFDGIRTDSPYMPIHAGKALSSLDLGFQGDDKGDNISKRNPGWSELTALYWMWKNLPHSEYVGLVHYRRYFGVEINDDTIDSIIKGNDILVSNEQVMGHHLATGIYWHIPRESFWLFADTLLSMHPECKDDFIDYFFFNNRLTPHCMFVCKRELMDEYCDFIFPVFFETEKRVHVSPYIREQRLFAYLGEWMLGFYILHRKLKAKHLPIVYVSPKQEEEPVPKERLGRKIMNKLHYKLDSYIETAAFKWAGLGRERYIKVDYDVLVGFEKDGTELRVLNEEIKHS